MATTLRLPSILDGSVEDAAALLSHYVNDRSSKGGPYFSGSVFESFRAGGDPNTVSPEDLLAVTMLDVSYPGAATLRILDQDSIEVSELLSRIPSDVDLADAGDEVIGRGSPAWALWQLLNDFYKVGPTRVSKLMARKRPRLIPIQDSVVRAAVGLGWDGDLWSGLRELLVHEDKALQTHLHDIRNKAGLDGQFSDLRVFDIVVWMAYRRQAD